MGGLLSNLDVTFSMLGEGLAPMTLETEGCVLSKCSPLGQSQAMPL